MAKRIAMLALALLGSAAVAAAERVPGPAPAGEPEPPRAGIPERIRRRPPPPPPGAPAKPPSAAPETAALGNALAGTWKCKGVSLRIDGGSTPMQATLEARLGLDNAWLVVTLSAPQVKYVEYRAFDATAKEWTRVQLVSSSAHVTATSLGERDGHWTWTGTAASSAGTVEVKDYEQHDGSTWKLWGEALLGGTWQKAYELACTR